MKASQEAVRMSSPPESVCMLTGASDGPGVNLGNLRKMGIPVREQIRENKPNPARGWLLPASRSVKTKPILWHGHPARTKTDASRRREAL